MTTTRGRFGALLLVVLASLLASGCATTAGRGGEANPRDPYESFNRAVFEFNEEVDHIVVRPTARAYDKAVPLPVKAGVGNFFSNVGDLWTGVNNGLQGKVGSGASDLARLLINSTIGIFGLFDVASEMGLDKHHEDFGQTLGRWGVGEGGYLVLPIIGPRTVRDTAGFAVDTYVDPLNEIDSRSTRNVASVLRFVDVRASLLPSDRVVEEAAIDKYVFIRDAYLQRRRNQVHDGKPPKEED